MAEISQAAEDLFFKLRNRFPKISMGDENGTKTINPEEARFFNFRYRDKKSDRHYGEVTCSIISGDALKVIFDSAITETMLPDDVPYWYSFLKELRRLAKRHMLNFDVRDITKDYLSKQDFDFMKMQNPEKKKMKESLEESRVLWQRKGKVSEGNLNNVRIHVVHNERMLENPHNRLLKVDRIFLVNESGEKFLLPFKSVSGAKAMANHMSRGGNPYDVQGQLIGRAVNEMRNLGRFIRSTNNKTFEAAEAGNVISSAVQMRESIKRHLNRLSNNSRNFSESLTELTNLISESPDDITEVKGWFTQQTYNENLDNYLASAAGAYKKLKENAMSNMVEAANAVEQKILDPNFKLVLKADSAMDKLMVSRDYRDTIAMLSAILGDIANRLVSNDGDDVANFASLMGDLISSEGEAFGTKPDDEYARDKKLAIMLAQKYMKDLHQVLKNPDYASQVRVSNKTREESIELRTEADDFAESIMGIGETEQVDEISKETIKSYFPKRIDSAKGMLRTDTDKAERITKKSLPLAMKKLKDPDYGKATSEKEEVKETDEQPGWMKTAEVEEDDENPSLWKQAEKVVDKYVVPIATPVFSTATLADMAGIGLGGAAGGAALAAIPTAANAGEPDYVAQNVAAQKAKDEQGVKEADIPLPPERPAALGGKHPMPPTRSQDEPMHDVNLGKLPTQNTQVAEPTGKPATPSFDDLAGDLWNAVKTDVKDMWSGTKTPQNTLPPGNYPGHTVEEDDMEEGNEFSGELAKAKANGDDSFEVDGKTYQVRESSINDLRKLAGLELLSEYTVTEAPPKNMGGTVTKANAPTASQKFQGTIKDFQRLNPTATVGQAMNAIQGKTAIPGGANDPKVIQQKLNANPPPGKSPQQAFDPAIPRAGSSAPAGISPADRAQAANPTLPQQTGPNPDLFNPAPLGPANTFKPIGSGNVGPETGKFTPPAPAAKVGQDNAPNPPAAPATPPAPAAKVGQDNAPNPSAQKPQAANGEFVDNVMADKYSESSDLSRMRSLAGLK